MGKVLQFSKRHDTGTSTTMFREALTRLRTARKWSIARLGLEAGIDHSLISRLESGQRPPTREAIAKIAPVVAPDDARARALLYIAAGFLPESPADYLRFLDPTVGELFDALRDKRIERAGKDSLRLVVASAVMLAYAHRDEQDYPTLEVILGEADRV